MSNPYDAADEFLRLDLLVQAKASIERLQSRYDRTREVAGEAGAESAAVVELLERQSGRFDAALDDDLNVPKALAALFDLVAATNQMPTMARRSMRPVCSRRARACRRRARGPRSPRARSGLVTKAEIAALVAPRTEPSHPLVPAILARPAAKQPNDYARADAIRSEMKREGVSIEDLAEGVRWKREAGSFVIRVRRPSLRRRR